jgi:hypothetical protein
MRRFISIFFFLFAIIAASSGAQVLGTVRVSLRDARTWRSQAPQSL